MIEMMTDVFMKNISRHADFNYENGNYTKVAAEYFSIRLENRTTGQLIAAMRGDKQ